jgi:hypothetical protein
LRSPSQVWAAYADFWHADFWHKAADDYSFEFATALQLTVDVATKTKSPAAAHGGERGERQVTVAA